MPRSVRPIDEQLLTRLPAKRLLAYRNRLLSLEESPELSDWETFEIADLDPAFIWFKSDPRWRDLYDQVLYCLNQREHIE